MRERMTPEQLTEIDRELDAFGVNADALRAVTTRARELAASLEGDEALSSLLAEASAAAARAAERASAAVAASAPERPPLTEHVPAPRPKRPERKDDPAPAAAKRKSKKPAKKAAPPVEAEPAPPAAAEPPRPAPTDFDDEPATMVMTAATAAAQVRADSTPPAASDIAGMSVDELFADAEPAAPAAGQSAGLADLFADDAMPGDAAAEPSGGLADLFADDQPEVDEPTMVGNLADLFAESEEVRLSDVDVDASAQGPSTAVLDPFDDPFSDEDDEETGHFSPAQMARLHAGGRAAAEEEVEVPLDDGDFELLVDEDVLELDPDAPAGDDEPPKPGLIGRLLGKK